LNDDFITVSFFFAVGKRGRSAVEANGFLGDASGGGGDAGRWFSALFAAFGGGFSWGGLV
jgi:hypothetical protein